MSGSNNWQAIAATIRSRHMVRSFTAEPVAKDWIEDVLDLSRRAPSAGNTQPWEFLVLEGDDVSRYWAITLGSAQSSFRWQGLLLAPVLVVPYVRPSAYVDRYAEEDKAATGLGGGEHEWPVPYWWVDGGAVVENLLLAVPAAGLGACFFGQFEHEAPLRDAFGVPEDRRALGTIAIGHPAGDDSLGRSSRRPRPDIGEIVHHGHWSA